MVLGALQDRRLVLLILQVLVGQQVGEAEEAKSYSQTFLVLTIVISIDRYLEGVALMLQLQHHDCLL